jgi:putative GTP pyrophosphokinase
LTTDLEEKGHIVTIESRTKSVASLEEKISRKGYETLDKATDLCGIRIITYLKDHYEEVCNIIEDNFLIDVDNSPNKQKLLDPNRFGYRSTHYVLCYKDEWLSNPVFKRFKGMKAEVQVRTIFQHAWAVIDWKLRYKPEEGAPPKDASRLIYRISALLETAEDDFTRVTKILNDLKSTYKKDIKHGNLTIDVNQLSLESFAKSAPIVEQLQQTAQSSTLSD